MTRRVFNKLVRDRIPDVIKKNGDEPFVRVLRAAEYKTALKQKLAEEVGEVSAATTKKSLIDELADVHEVLRALYSAYGVSPTDITKAAQKKRKERGGFVKRIFLIETK